MDAGDPLEPARTACAAGDLARARRIAEPLAQAEDAELRAAAARLLRSVTPDGVEVAVIVVCLLGLMAITWSYLL